MRLKCIKDVDDFMKSVEKCKGGVYLTSQYGDKFNLKSKLNCYVAIGKMISDENNALELWCENKEDESIMLKFFYEHPNV